MTDPTTDTTGFRPTAQPKQKTDIMVTVGVLAGIPILAAIFFLAWEAGDSHLWEHVTAPHWLELVLSVVGTLIVLILFVGSVIAESGSFPFGSSGDSDPADVIAFHDWALARYGIEFSWADSEQLIQGKSVVIGEDRVMLWAADADAEKLLINLTTDEELPLASPASLPAA